MSKLKLLYVAPEISPFLETSDVAKIIYHLTNSMQKKEVDTRIIVPKFGVINDRKNRLHEVVRLSDTKIQIGTEDRFLAVKVASIPKTKLQIYFLDNEEYFQRNGVFFDKSGKFYKDNDERTVFFCHSVLKTIKNFAWIPDIIHCHDWVTGLIPLYLKNTKKNTIFEHSKVIYTLYDSPGTYHFENDLLKSIISQEGIIDEEIYRDNIPWNDRKFSKIGASYADTAVAHKNLKNQDWIKALNIPFIDHNDIDAAVEYYYALYNNLK